MDVNRRISIKCKSSKTIHLTLSDDDLSLSDSVKSLPSVVPLRQILFIEGSSSKLRIEYVIRRKGKGLLLCSLEGEVVRDSNAVPEEWAEVAMKKVYEEKGVERNRKLLVIVNPKGGVGKGASVFKELIEPILKSAKCELEIIYTTGRQHAYDIAKTLCLQYHAIVSVSGDGLVHEIINGLANHSTPAKALRTPIAPIPTGSGNGLSMNVLGPEDGFDVVAAALNAIKGKAMRVDLFSVIQDGNRTISFMSQALGLMADLDLGTEHLRWMGDKRFLYGLFRGVALFKRCPVQLSFKPVERDKHTMVETFRRRREERSNHKIYGAEEEVSGLPPLRFDSDENDDWVTFDEPLLYVYAGKGPYVGRDLMMFPVSLPDDGLVDIAVQPISSRSDILTAIPDAAKGSAFWTPSMQYIKAHAYRIKTLSKKGFLSIDGEGLPFRDFQVEVHQGLGTILSPHGHYAADFEITSDQTNRK